MIQKLKLLFVVTLVLALGGCATAPGHKFSGLADPAKDQGDVYLYRTSAFFAGGQAFEVMVDGKRVGKLYNASFIQLRLPPGSHALTVSPGGIAQSSDRRIQVEAGKTAFFQYDFTTGPLANVFFLGSSIEPRSEEHAMLDMKELNSAN